MALVKLIYTSHTAGPIDPEDLTDILESARSFNGAHSITGMLCYGDGRFIQYLEGEPGAVNELYAKILGDPRHYKVTLTVYDMIRERSFADWSMGYVDMDDQILSRVYELFGLEGFKVERLNSHKAMALIEMLKHRLHPQHVVEPELERAGSLAV